MLTTFLVLVGTWTYGDLSGDVRRKSPIVHHPAPSPPDAPAPAPPPPADVPPTSPRPIRPAPSPVRAAAPVAVHAARPIRYWVQNYSKPGWEGHGRIVGGWLVDVDEERWTGWAVAGNQNVLIQPGVTCANGTCYRGR